MASRPLERPEEGKAMARNIAKTKSIAVSPGRTFTVES
jgi:hypothetical protein